MKGFLARKKSFIFLMGLCLFNGAYLVNVWAGADRPGTPSISAPTTSTTGSFTVSWGSIYAATQYKIAQTGSSIENYSSTSTSLNISGLSDGSYHFKVQACSSNFRMFSNECSNDSNQVTVTVQRPPGIPGNINIPGTTSGSYSISWGGASGTIERYEVREHANGGWSGWSNNGTSLTKSFSSKSDGSYLYQVRACNSVAGCSSEKQSGSFTVLNVPGQPGVITVPGSTTQGNYNISWTGSTGSVERYEYLERHNGVYGVWISNGNSSNISFSAKPDGDYLYQVRAVNAMGNSQVRWSAGFSVLNPPSAPGDITVPGSTTGSYTISWGAASGAVSNYYYRESSNDGSSFSAWVDNGTATSKAFNGKGDGNYIYSVRACNSIGSCGNERLSTSFTVLNLPGQPGAIAAPSGTTQGNYTIGWVGSTGSVSHYEYIERHNGVYGSWINNGTSTNVNLSGKPDGDYLYQVRAWNASGYSDVRWSPGFTVINPPGIPSHIIVPTGTTIGNYTISWGSASGTAERYEFRQSFNNSWSGWVSTGTGQSVAQNGKVDGNYRYQVRACNSVGGCGDVRESASFTVLNIPGIPGTITEPVGVVQLESYYISWGDATGEVSRYEYQTSTNNGTSYGAWQSNGISKRIDFYSSQAGYEGQHRYQVRACNASGCGAVQTSSNILVYQTPGKPSSITVPNDAVGSGYFVSWGGGSGTATDYQIRQEYNGVWSSWVGTGTAQSKSYTLGFGGQVRNEVRACNPAGCSASETSDFYEVKTNSICPQLPSDKSGFEMMNIGVTPTSINSFQISYSYQLDNMASGEAANNPPTEFLIQYSFNGGNFYDIARVGTTNYAVSGLPVGHHQFRVQGISSFTCASNIITGATQVVHEVPSTPGAFSKPNITTPTPSLSCDTSSYNVDWPDTFGANQYQLQARYASSSVTDFNINESIWSGWGTIPGAEAVNVSTFQHQNLEAGSTYQYRVRARIKLSGHDFFTEWSGWQESGKVRRPHCAPDAPDKVTGITEAQYPSSTSSSILTHLDRDGSFRMEWLYLNTAEESLVGYYEVQRYGTKISPDRESDRLLSKTYELKEAIGGIYRYDVIACNVDGCSTPSDYLEVTVALPAEPPSLPAPFDFVADPDIHANANVYEGNLKGSLNVSPNGAATYSLPVAIPPGTAGIAPKLSLDYSSQSGNGLLGTGWALGGLSMVTRCPQTLAQDQHRGSVKYDQNDRFCLDGKRLVVVEGEYGAAGSVYRTELDSFDIITAKGSKGNGPAWFEVKTKTGEVLEYGNTTDSQVEATGKETVALWAVNRVEDTVSNYYTVEYYEGSETEGTEGEFYPTAFHYTGNVNEGLGPYTTVSLVYEDRPDKRTSYHLGSKTMQAKRLKKVVTDIGEYQLEYVQATDFQASRIDAIQHCDMNNNCPSTRRLSFAWQENNGQAGWGNVLPEDNTAYQFVDEDGRSYYKSIIDIDGDGNVEMISSVPAYYVNGGEPCIKNCDPSDPDYQAGGHVPAQLLISSSLGVNGPGWEEYPGPKPAISTYTVRYDNPFTEYENEHRTYDAGVRFVDLNGDGYMDILQGWGVTLKAWLHGPNRGDGWTESTDYASPEPFIDDESQDRGTRILDLNGDGLPDILRMQNNVAHRAWLNTGSGWLQVSGWAIDSLSIARDDEGLDEGARFADINGDGLVDMLLWRDYGDPGGGAASQASWLVYSNGNLNQRYTYINTGSGFERVTSGGYHNFDVIFVDNEGRDQGLRLVDINGDGLPDLMSAITGDSINEPYQTWLNTGSGWEESQAYRMPMPFTVVYDANTQVPEETYTDYGTRMLDINADGLVDIIRRGFTGTGRVVLNTGQGWNEVNDSVYKPKVSIVTGQDLTPDNYFDVKDTGVRFADINSDGQVDFIGYKVNHNQAKPLLITGITDGLGNEHVIHYKPLTDPAVYDLEDNVQAVHLRDARMASPVVYQVDTPDGRDGPQTQEYLYSGLVFNTQGLGSLGFREIKITDKTTNFYSKTVYSQTYPYVGIPEHSISYTNNNDVISETYNLVMDVLHTKPSSTAYVSNGNNLKPEAITHGEKIPVPAFPYIKESTVTTHHFNNAMQPVGSKVTTTTSNEYDLYGNATKIITEVDDHQGKVWKTQIINDYSLDGLEHERMGRLTQATVTKSINNIPDVNSIRVTVFDYDDTTHLLIKETVEPGRGEPETLVTVYDHDGFGNRTSVTVCAKQVSACSVGSIGPPDLPHRTTTTSYDPNDYPSTHPYAPTGSVRGRFPVLITNAKGHQESYRYDHNLGVVTEQTGPNGLSTCFEHDTWGRPIKERSLCGTVNEIQTVSEYHLASEYTEHAAYTVSNYIAGREHATTTRSYSDSMGRKLRTQSRGFKGQIIYVDRVYDERGRPQKVSEPYFYSAGYAPVIHWNETTLIDDFGRVQQELRPVGDISYDPSNGDLVGNPEPPVPLNTIYNGFETQVTDAKGRIKATYKNAIGQTVKTIDAYGTALQSQITFDYDSQGNLITTTDQMNNLIELGHDIHGRKVWMKDPDMGQHINADTQWTYVYNGYGELSEQTDAKGQVTHMEYDSLGRMITRTDLYGTAQAQTSTWVYDTAAGAGLGKLHTETGQYASKLHTYNQYGRLISTTQTLTTSIETGSFTTEWRYDELGRRSHVLYPEIDVSTPRVWMNYQYNEFGYLHYMLDITEDPAGVVYWRADEVNARGQLEEEQYRNRTFTQQYHNEANGWLDATFTLDGTTANMNVPSEDNLIQHTHYQYDVNGNVKTKTGRANGLDHFQTDLTEHYEYDEHNRLVSTGISGYDAETGSPFGVGEKTNYPARTYQYDLIGNITHKDGVGDYYYGSECGNGGAGPHAVCEIRSANVVMKSYQYDANGNMTYSYIGPVANNTKEREIYYTAFNKPYQIIDISRVNQTSAEFYYGANRSRVLRVADEIKFDDQNNETTQRERIAYIGHGATGGTIMERKTNETTGKITYIHFMYAGGYHSGQAFAMRVIEQQGGVSVYVGTEYYHRDHLGSVIAITDDTGLKRAYDQSNQATGGAHAFLKGYDAWGKRRNPNWSEDPNGESQYTSTRGHLSYTGQEAITGVGLIHMNGRVYDPELGRFLSADPHIQSEGFSQSYNRYSYVWNNPVNSTDPSGYFKKWLQGMSPKFAKIFGAFLNFIPGCQGWCSRVFSAAYAISNGANTQNVFRGMAIGFMASGIGGSAASAAGYAKGSIGYRMVSRLIGGAIGGGINAAISGRSIVREAARNAKNSMVAEAMVWGLMQSVANTTTKNRNILKDLKKIVKDGSLSSSGDNEFVGPPLFPDNLRQETLQELDIVIRSLESGSAEELRQLKDNFDILPGDTAKISKVLSMVRTMRARLANAEFRMATASNLKADFACTTLNLYTDQILQEFIDTRPGDMFVIPRIIDDAIYIVNPHSVSSASDYEIKALLIHEVSHFAGTEHIDDKPLWDYHMQSEHWRYYILR